MSGFDFDALRDPEAPLPGGRERADVAARAGQLRAQGRRKRLAVSATAIVAATAIVLGVVATTRDNGPSISVESPSTTTANATPITSGVSAVADRFVPPTRFEADRVVLPVTFPDGETVTLRYPTPMKIAELGFAGFGGVIDLSGDSGRQVGLSYTTMDKAFAGTAPTTVFPGSQGQEVRLYLGKDPTLAFQFGPWLVRVSDGDKPMTDSQLAAWARNLTGSLDPNGYLILHAAAPLSISNTAWFDGGFGAFGKGNLLELALHISCGQPESDTSAHRKSTDATGTHVSWCDGDLHVVANGSKNFVDLADNELKVSPLTSPLVSETTTSTSTTTVTSPSPGVSSDSAESSSWVSPQHGWALEKNGRVDTTTDGGTTWHQTGSLGVATDATGMKIRFADASRGFAFDDSRFLVTDDGGVTWKKIATPFSRVFDLAISRGVVYVVGIPAQASNFRIWSASADTLAWTEDPLAIPVGAGPIPEIQLVFSGTNGWLIENDRVVTAGARMSSSGVWSAWTPPCSKVNGPAQLAASSAADLVAACSEHDYGGGPITSGIYFSHDGGRTFGRHDAPGNGLVASPNSTTAVVATNGGLRRTVDGGATWNSVLADPNGYGATDIGFTTTSQGFVVLRDGRMLMTYDAGATWSPATLR